MIDATPAVAVSGPQLRSMRDGLMHALANLVVPLVPDPNPGQVWGVFVSDLPSEALAPGGHVVLPPHARSAVGFYGLLADGPVTAVEFADRMDRDTRSLRIPGGYRAGEILYFTGGRVHAPAGEGVIVRVFGEAPVRLLGFVAQVARPGDNLTPRGGVETIR